MQLEKLRQWLQNSSFLDSAIRFDFTEDASGNTGLFPLGLEERSRKRDLMGNLQIDHRCRFQLLVQMPRAAGAASAQWLMDFQNWVYAQSAAGLAPVFGDVPQLERLWAEKGALKNVSRSGVATYAVTLIADFVKVYER